MPFAATALHGAAFVQRGPLLPCVNGAGYGVLRSHTLPLTVCGA